MLPRRFTSLIVSLCTAATLLLSAQVAEAIPAALRPSTRPMFFVFGIGPAIGVTNTLTQFKMTQEFGWHFWGKGDGPAIGVALQESFGSHSFSFQIGPRFWWDIQIVKGLGLYLTPMAQIGYALQTFDRWWYDHYYDRWNNWYHYGDTFHGFNLQFGFEPRLVIGNRGIVFFRLFTIDIAIGGNDRWTGAWVRYDLMFGGGVTF